jgi:hypothetical protein
VSARLSHLDADEDGSYEHLFNEDLIVLGLARTTTFSHTYRRRFERLREESEERGTGLWSACPAVEPVCRGASPARVLHVARGLRLCHPVADA